MELDDVELDYYNVNRVYLSIPYRHTQLAKKMGAIFDWEEKSWFAPEGKKALVRRWQEVEIVGEDRKYGGNELKFEFIPRSTWGKNARNLLKRGGWGRLRRYVYKRAKGRCEICKVKGVRLDCHERWEWKGDVQKLMRLMALCRQCHSAIHLNTCFKNFVRVVGHIGDILGRDSIALCEKEEERLAEKDQIKYKIDLSILTKGSFELKE